MLDDCPRPARESELTQRVRVNFSDGLYEFQAAYGRKPQSWMDYHHGMAHLARAGARRSVQQANAARIAQARPEDWTTWRREVGPQAEW